MYNKKKMATNQTFDLEDVTIMIDDTIVGHATSVSVSWSQQNKPMYGNGSKKPFEIKDGEIGISGTIEKFFISASDVTSLVDLENGRNPYFTFVGKTKYVTPQKKVSIIDAKINGFDLNIATGDGTKVPRKFDALDMKVE